MNNKTTRHVAIAKCNYCGEYLVSWAGGIFEYCKCKKSFIDQDRFGGSSVRVGGDNIDFIEQICPSTCEFRNEEIIFHKENKQIDTKQKLRNYLLKTYNYKLPKEY